MSATNFRVLLPETLWLEPEHFEQAREISNRQNNEQQQWQTYLNTLAAAGFAAWLSDRLTGYPIQQIANQVEDVSYLKVDDFRLCLIATEHVLDEVVRVPKIAIEQLELAAHFYVALEVLEDEKQMIIRGFLKHDELTALSNQIISSQPDQVCLLPLSAFDSELNHLVSYIQYSESHAFPLPTALAQSVEVPLLRDFSAFKNRLSQWLQGALDEGWQTIDTLIHPEANLAWSTRQTSLVGAKGGKLINFGVQLNHQTVALLVMVMPENEGKIGIGIQVLPAGGAQTLPAQLKLALLSSTDKILQEVQSRGQDNYIQLKPFKGKPGVNFSIEVSLNDIKVKEVFEL